MEALHKLGDYVQELESRFRNLTRERQQLDAQLKEARGAMDFSQLAWRASGPPPRTERIWKDECALSFATPYAPGGLFINMQTLCAYSREHVGEDWRRTGGKCAYLHQQWEWIPDDDENEEENKDNGDKKRAKRSEVTKLAIGVEGGFDAGGERGHVRKTYSLAKGPEFDAALYAVETAPPELRAIVDEVVRREDAARELEVLAWEASNDVVESKYARNLVQLADAPKLSPDPSTWKCQDSGLSENLWLNLSTGYVGSGRAQWGGANGTGAALRHFQDTGACYPLAVKLGTITPDGKADVYSYAPDEDCMVTDPLLTTHLAHFGIRVGDMRKTEKTLAELELDQNLKHEWNLLSEDGKELEMVSGPNHVGLVNLGNSCYCNSVFQGLFALEAFRAYWTESVKSKHAVSATNPQQDLLQQFIKLADAFRDPASNVRKLSHKPFAGNDSVTPRMLKTLLGEGHRDFSTPEQQDAAEYAAHVMSRLERAIRQDTSGNLDDITRAFQVQLEDRIECLQSHQVQYKRAVHPLLQLNVPYVPPATTTTTAAAGAPTPAAKRDEVPFADCVQATLNAPERLTDYFSNATGLRGEALKTTRLVKYPRFLLVQLRRFVLAPSGWTAIKMECGVPAPTMFDFGGEFKGTGLQPGETLLPEHPPANSVAAAAAGSATAFVPDARVLEMIQAQGFSRNCALRAAQATGNNLEAAVEWVMQHLDDSDLNDPPPSQTATASSPAPPSAESIDMLVNMGFDASGAKFALQKCDNNLERAADFLFNRSPDELRAEMTAAVVTSSSSSSNNNSASSAPAVAAVDEQSVASLAGMGFEQSLARFALRKANGSVEAAADYLFSKSLQEVETEKLQEEEQQQQQGVAAAAAAPPVLSAAPGDSALASENPSTLYHLRAVISHVGRSTNSGHYVCHVNEAPVGDTPRWIFFNDEKVLLAQNPPMDQGYVLVYEQVLEGV